MVKCGDARKNIWSGDDSVFNLLFGGWPRWRGGRGVGCIVMTSLLTFVAIGRTRHVEDGVVDGDSFERVEKKEEEDR